MYGLKDSLIQIYRAIILTSGIRLRVIFALKTKYYDSKKSEKSSFNFFTYWVISEHHQ
jgi:hypothetical protein